MKQEKTRAKVVEWEINQIDIIKIKQDKQAARHLVGVRYRVL